MLKVNDKIGLLTLIKRESKIQKGRRYWFWFCWCKCGNQKWILEKSLTKKNPTQSCGCLQAKTLFKKTDLTGKKFNNLKVIESIGEGNGYNEKWLCQCECGNKIVLTRKQIDGKKIKSCGCKIYESQLENQKKAFEKFKEDNLVDGTSIVAISRNKPISTNTSGVTGVSWINSRQKWQSQIVFKGKTYNLGRYDKKEDAIKARKEAEQKLFGAFLKVHKKRE